MSWSTIITSIEFPQCGKLLITPSVVIARYFTQVPQSLLNFYTSTTHEETKFPQTKNVIANTSQGCVVYKLQELQPESFACKMANVTTATLVCLLIHLSSCTRIRNEVNSNRKTTLPAWRNVLKFSKFPATVSEAAEGGRLEIECVADGVTPIVIEWYKDDAKLTDNEIVSNEIEDNFSHDSASLVSRLYLPKVLKSHEGTYTCVASNDIRELKVSTNVRIFGGFENLLPESYDVVFSSPRITYFVAFYVSHIGNQITLPCKTAGYPAAQISWKTPHGEVTGEDVPRIKINPDGSLRISDLIWLYDSGNYTCFAKNSVGEDQASTYVFMFSRGN